MFIKNIINNLDFWLRKRIKLSRGRYFAKNELKFGLFDYLNEEEKSFAELKEKEYCKKYNLFRLKENSTRVNYRENLYIIDLLEKNLNVDAGKTDIIALDIGSKNWFYAQGEYQFFQYWGCEKNIQLNGIEIDAFRVCIDLYSRYDYAKSYINDLKNANYIVGDLMEHKGEYDYISWFLPFISKKPLLNWGLPIKYFKPKEMMIHSYSLLKPEGKMLIVNQGEKEHLMQVDLLKDLNIPFEIKGAFQSVFYKYDHERFVVVIQK